MKAYIDKAKCASDNRICKPMKECPICAISRIEDEEMQQLRNMCRSVLRSLY